MQDTTSKTYSEVAQGLQTGPPPPHPVSPAYCGAIKGAAYSLGQSSGDSVIPRNTCKDSAYPCFTGLLACSQSTEMKISQPSVRNVGFRITPDAATCKDFGLRTTS